MHNKGRRIKKILVMTAIAAISMASTVLAQNAIFDATQDDESTEVVEDTYVNDNPVDENFVGAYSKKSEAVGASTEEEVATDIIAFDQEESMTKEEIQDYYESLIKKCGKKNKKNKEDRDVIIETNEPIYNLPDITYTPYISAGVVAQVDPTYSQKEFIETIGKIAASYWDEYQLLPSVTIAQAIIESRWGKSSLGSSYHNYFGIKYTQGCGSDYVILQTSEQKVNGAYYQIQAKFRAYLTMADGIRDRYRFLTENARYSNLIGVTDYRTECALLQQDGYATSLTYAQTLIDTIERYGLQEYDNLAINDNLSADEDTEKINSTKEKSTAKIDKTKKSVKDQKNEKEDIPAE